MAIRHYKSMSIVTYNIKAKLPKDLLKKRVEKAQFWLDSQIMTDMVPYMPHVTETMVNVTRAQSAALAGTGTVIAAAAPTGRFLYMGKGMVDEQTGSPFARKGAKKVVTDKPLTYSNPRATPFWFETAKKEHGKQWVEGVKKILTEE